LSAKGTDLETRETQSIRRSPKHSSKYLRLDRSGNNGVTDLRLVMPPERTSG
jgi:hypothetical protein